MSWLRSKNEIAKIESNPYKEMVTELDNSQCTWDNFLLNYLSKWKILKYTIICFSYSQYTNRLATQYRQKLIESKRRSRISKYLVFLNNIFRKIK